MGIGLSLLALHANTCISFDKQLQLKKINFSFRKRDVPVKSPEAQGCFFQGLSVASPRAGNLD